MANTPHTAPSHSDSGRLPLFSQVRQPLNSTCFYREFNEAGDGGDDDGGEGGDEGGEGDKGSGDKGDSGDGGDDTGDKDKKGSKSQSRIEDLVSQRDAERQAREEAERKLKEREDADKKAAEEKLKEEGKLKELLESKESELSEATASREELQGKVEKYEEFANDQIANALEAIEDEEQREAADAMLEGRDTLDKFSLLPKVLKLAGKSTESHEFGNKTPNGEKKTGQLDVDQKQARLDELNQKQQKGEITAQEKSEKYRLSNELSALWNRDKSNAN